MAKIRIIRLLGGSAPVEYRRALVGLVFDATAVAASAPRPNTDGRAYEIETFHAADVLFVAGKREAAEFFRHLNRFPAMQWLGYCVETAAAEAA